MPEQQIKKEDKKRIAIIFIVWWLVWGSIHTAVLQFFNITYSHALTDAAVSYSILAAACLFIMNNMRYYLPKKEKYLYVIVISFALTAIWLALDRGILRSIYKRDDLYLQFLDRSLVIRYMVAFLMIACNTLLSLTWYTQKEQAEENERRADTERLAREAELNKLRQQLQPHFLFNSLNSISALTGQQPEKARHMIQQLSDFLRGTLRNEGLQWATLQSEMDHLQLYLDIEKVRFGYRLQSIIQTEQDALQLQLPSMLLQPLVENAIKFGLYDTIGEVEIIITAAAKADMLEVTVKNPYDESTAMQIKGTGFGLASVRRRLFLLFGRQDLLLIDKTTDTFMVTLRIPQRTHENN